MKKLLLLPLVVTSLFFTTFAQNTPDLINYQAVAHNSNGDLLSNQALTVKIGILSSSTTGTLVYEEDHSLSTNDYGLFSLKIGSGTSTGNGTSTSLSTIIWSSNTYFLSVSIDAGNGFETLGTMQLVSVPYALNSKNTEQIQNKNVSSANPNDGDIMVYNASSNIWEYQANTGGSTYSAGSGISITGTVIDNTGDIDATDDITNSTSAGGDLSGTYPSPTVTGFNGNSIISGTPANGDILVFNSTSGQWEYQAYTNGTVYTAGTGISITGTTINNTGDLDPLNEIQNLSFNPNGDSLLITNGIGARFSAVVPTPGQVLAWNGTNWEAQNAGVNTDNQNISFNATRDSITISGGTGIAFTTSVPTSGQVLTFNGTDWQAVTLLDNNATNEIQNLSFNPNGDSLLITNGIGARFSAVVPTTGQVLAWNGTNWEAQNAGVNTDNQNISFNATRDSITISGGTGIAFTTSVPTSGQVLTFNGTDWQAVTLLDNDPANEYNTSFGISTGLDSLVIRDQGTYFGVPLADIVGSPTNIYASDGLLLTDRTVTQAAYTLNFAANSTQPVSTFSNSGFTGSWVNIDAGNAGSPSSLNLMQQGTIKGQISSTANGMRLYGAAGIPRIGINTDPSATTGILQINYAGSNADPGIYMVNPNNGATSGLNRITMANSLVAGKYWEMAGGANTSGDAVSAWTVSYNDGTNYKQFLAVYGDKKVAVGDISAANSSTFDVFGTTTLHDSLTIDNGTSNPYSFPVADGAANYVMQTNGSGIVSWVDPSTFGGSSGWSLTGNASTIPGTGGGQNFLGTIDASDLLIATNSTPAMWINGGDQNVGIGITAPLGKLHTLTQGATNLLISHSISDAAIDNSGSVMLVRARGTLGSENYVQSGDRLGVVSFNGYNTGALDYNEGGFIAVTAEEDFISTGAGSRMSFHTTQMGTNSTIEAMVINSNQHVGIGQSAPTAKLDVNGTFKLTDGTQAAGYVLTSDAAGNASWQATGGGSSSRINDVDNNTFIETDSPGDGTEDFIHFSTNGVERLSITNSGNIGINTTSPNNKLSIVTDASNGFEMQTYGNGNTNMMSFIHYGGVIGTPTLTNSGDIIGTSLYSGYGVTTDVAAAKIEVIAEANFTDGSAPGSIVFGTTPTGSNAPIERMRVSTNGNVGIGSTNPAVKLDVNGDVGISNDSQRIVRIDEGSDLVPIAYGVINDGTLEAAASTSNFSVTKLGLGQYQVTYTGPRPFGGLGEFHVTLTPYYQGTTLIASYQYLGGTSFEIFLTNLSDVLTDGMVSFTLRVK